MFRSAGLIPCGVYLLVGALLAANTNARAEAPWTLERMRSRDPQGGWNVHAKPVAPQFRNQWPAAWEQEFQRRGAAILEAQNALRVKGGNTYFENEKRTYGFLMAQALGERHAEAIAALQIEDAQAKDWHRHTAGIDYYAAFTLKHQIRKYFYFGDMLAPDYRQRMKEGARLWTARDPFRRPHHAYQGPKAGWGPDAKNSWVDVRSTENLFLMRVTSVYLMAEETGNRETAEIYKRQLLDYTATLYRIGMGEWDSENYHGHSLAPLLNLYDFARDAEVKLAAKACLDWMFAIGAVKYYRGGFNGPTKRDYNHSQPFGGSAAAMLWVAFGDAPRANSDWESDEVHLLTSAYRPPAAVVEVARRKIALPVQLFASKPSYAATTSFDRDSQPEYLETQYLGHTFAMGSLAGGTRPGASDVNGFKILLADPVQGARALQGVPGPDPRFVGSPQYQEGKVSGENRVAQDRNLALWLVAQGDAPWCWVVPQSIAVSQRTGVTFLRGDQTWIALRPLNAGPIGVDEKATRELANDRRTRFPEHRVLATRGTGEKFCGVAIEVGEPQTHESFERFVSGVLKAELELAKIEQGIVTYRASDGKWLGLHWNEDPHQLGVWRNGTRHDWTEHAKHHYWSETGKPLAADWGSGRLTVTSDSYQFVGTVDSGGHYEFRSLTAP